VLNYKTNSPNKKETLKLYKAGNSNLKSILKNICEATLITISAIFKGKETRIDWNKLYFKVLN